MGKPKILIIGHARHGKDDFAQILSEVMDLRFSSSSWFVANEFIWPFWGKHHYQSFPEMFKDRINFRKLWADMINIYNTPDKTKTVSTMFDRDGLDMYVGLRRRDEFKACMEQKKFNMVIWVDALSRHEEEPFSSMELNHRDADFIVNNNVEVTVPEGSTDEYLFQMVRERLLPQALEIQKKLHHRGFDVNYKAPASNTDAPTKGERLSWEDMPEGSTPVLDHGFIRVEDVYGTDAKICEAARMSYGRGTKSVNADEGLIRYLVTNHHTSPLEMCEIKFHIRLPIFVMRQLVRHRTANLNEYSARYSEMVRLFYVPEVGDIRGQHKTNKQGSGDPINAGHAADVQHYIRDTSNNTFDTYEALLKNYGVSRETARIILPLNTYTEVVWKMDVNNLLKLLYLRDDIHAQWEIRVYAQEMSKAVQKYFPSVFKAYERVRGSTTLSEDQLMVLIESVREVSHKDGGDYLPGVIPQLPKGELAQVKDILGNYGID